MIIDLSLIFFWQLETQQKITLGVVIDLSSTAPRYNVEDLQSHGIQYVKIQCKLNLLKSNSKKFIKIVNEFLSINKVV